MEKEIADIEKSVELTLQTKTIEAEIGLWKEIGKQLHFFKWQIKSDRFLFNNSFKQADY